MAALRPPKTAQHPPQTARTPIHGFAAPRHDRTPLNDALDAKRAVIHDLEAAWVAAAEAAVTTGHQATIRVGDRETWDSAAWDRYLAAAATHEPTYMPQIARLLREIDALERLLALEPTPATRAA